LGGSNRLTGLGNLGRISRNGFLPFLGFVGNLLVTLAPYESNGPDDTEEWNLFDTYLDSTVKAFNDPHDLSTMLQRWHEDVVSPLYTSLRFIQRNMANQIIRH